MRWKTRPRPRQLDNVRVVRDIKNSNMDYWITKTRAEELFNEGKLVKIEAYANKISYATKTPDEYYV
jgi:hypothetical protein